MFSLNDKRATNRGFGDGMSRAFEFAATPLVFGVAGYGLDLWLDTKPAFTIGLAAFAVVGMFLRVWFGYDAEMRTHEQAGSWVRREPSAADTATAGADDGDLWARRRPMTEADA